MAGSIAARSHQSRAGTDTPSRAGMDMRDDSELDRIGLKLRAAVGDSAEIVDLSCFDLLDPDIKVLVRLLV